ncbi:MAG: restriction endonuclease [Pseudomonadota bacterium]
MLTLTIENLHVEAKQFAEYEGAHWEPSLFGVNDGKAIGTYLEQKFTKRLASQFDFVSGNSASGIDLPGLNVDIKTTSIRQPQSSCPFKSARQKVFGLGYHLLVFVYEKIDEHETKLTKLNILHTIFVSEERTADFQTTRGILNILNNQGNADDLKAFFEERNLPVDEIAAEILAEEILQNRPLEGYLTISNALQWRLQYTRVIEKAGKIDGLLRIV